MTMTTETARQVEGLRAAAAKLGGPVASTLDRVTVPVYDDAGTAGLLDMPGVAARPLARWLLAAAERIEMRGYSLGQPVNNALDFAGAILGQDLGHNR